MSTRKYFLAFLFICTTIYSDKPIYPWDFCLKERTQPIDLTTSVIIPCHHSHFKFLFNLLEHLSQQSVTPNEVVISLSEANKVDNNRLEELQNFLWPFALKLICTNNKKKAGINRNIACSKAQGELLLCIDADDIPHEKRVEITKYLFEKYHIDLMLHQHSYSSSEFSTHEISLDNFEFSKLTYLNPFLYIKNVSYYTNGHPSLLKTVFNKVKWTSLARAEDFEFNLNVCLKFHNLLYLPMVLSLYNEELSTTKIGNIHNIDYIEKNNQYYSLILPKQAESIKQKYNVDNWSSNNGFFFKN